MYSNAGTLPHSGVPIVLYGGVFVKWNKKNIWCVIMMTLIIVFDRITKYFAKMYLCGKDAKEFIKGVAEFAYAENTGVAFSLFSGGRWFFIVLTAVLIILCLYIMFSGAGRKNLWLYWSLGVIISGAAGNLIDRIIYGYVIDFINPTFIHFAVFNIADCAVTLGSASLVGYLVFDMFKKEKGNE